jgi:hypothetical protein
MLFAVGTKVRLKNTGDEGVITERLSDDMFTVYLPKMDMDIPTFESNLIRLDKNSGQSNAHFVKGKQAVVPPKPLHVPIDTQYTLLSSQGILLAFDPQYDTEKIITHFNIYLINATHSEVLFSFELNFNEQPPTLKANAKLDHVSLYPLGTIQYQQLNDAPTVQLSCWRITTQGTEHEIKKTLRLKPKTFFSTMLTAPLLNKPTYLFSLIEDLKKEAIEKPKKETEDLVLYTKKNIAKNSKSLKHDVLKPNEVKEYAEFVPEIDLHIEQLVTNVGKMDKADILRTQLKHFDFFLEKAVRLGVEKIFIIHGVGTGKLKESIASRLIRHPYVTTFKNEYHPRYGWGATEAILEA